tara:strand:+ start:29 stop:835 length:807 start_codon:yes stop_codon:yes gene_type:complete
VLKLKSSDYKAYSKFIENLAKKLTKFYYSNLDKPFKVSNKLRGKGYDPVTSADKAFERFIRSEIKKNFPDHQVVGEEFGHKKSKSDFKWVLDPIDGTRSFVIGNPSWSNLVSLNYKDEPILGLANFPILKKYYFNTSDKNAYIFENGRKRKIKVNDKSPFTKLKVSGAFHGGISLKLQKKIPKVLKLMQFPCTDALSYSHLAEGKIDVVFQAVNKIWDINPLIPIILAAGGLVTTWKNENASKGGNILVTTNKKTHNKFLKLLKPITK